MISGDIMSPEYSTQHQPRTHRFPDELLVIGPKKCNGLPLLSNSNEYESAPIETSSAVTRPPSSKVGLATTSSWVVVNARFTAE
jgi:hypothetical protein